MSISVQPKDYQVLFLDMNSFFASVEQQVQPTLRGKPIGVAPYTGGTGCIIAASREAKKLGVKGGIVREMKKICPELIVLEARPALYMFYHKEIKRIIEKETPFFEPSSIDEFKILLCPRERNEKEAVSLGLRIKERIKNEVGDFLTCSVGVSANKFLAKMAAEQKKPDGMTVIRLKDLDKFYQSQRLTDLTGINHRLAARLKICGINDASDLYKASLYDLRRVLDHWGRLWYFRLRGYEVDNFEIKNKTIGHSCVLPPEFRSREGALSVLKKLVFKAGKRLRSESFFAQGVFVSIGFLEGGSYHKSIKTELFCDNSSFAKHVDNLLKSCFWRGKPIYVSVSAFGLVRLGGKPISIFPEIEKSRAISQALDLINDQYGAEMVVPASILNSREAAPDRIPFGSPRYDILH